MMCGVVRASVSIRVPRGGTGVSPASCRHFSIATGRIDHLAVISLGDWVVALFLAQGWMCDE